MRSAGMVGGVFLVVALSVAASRVSGRLGASAPPAAAGGLPVLAGSGTAQPAGPFFPQQVPSAPTSAAPAKPRTIPLRVPDEQAYRDAKAGKPSRLTPSL